MLILFGTLWAACLPANEESYSNPVLPGGFPDPSVCRMGEYYYLVNSSFEYFPGLPIHRSRDLVNWQLVGYGLHREEQVTGPVNLVDVQSNGGIHAPSIRCRDGIFHIITTNVYQPPTEGEPTEMVNFVITASSAEGPWSMPKVLEGAPGIDPDIFFDDDGRAWYVGTHSPENPSFPGEGEIWLQQIDTESWSLTGARHFLWRGACGGTWAEGPHLYKRDGRYYLMVAEGGTSFDHAVMIAVSDNITGPYHSNPRNPILTSRHLTYDYWVNSTGHGDLLELPDGRWYMLLLGIRGDESRRSNMGRETHLVPVSWEREPYEWKEVKYEWPVAAPLTGRVERRYPVVFPGSMQQAEPAFRDDFDGDELRLEWNFRRYPLPGTWSLQQQPGHLRLKSSPRIIRERGRASLMGIRQTQSEFTYSARMLFTPRIEGSESGLALFQKDDNYLSFTVRKENEQAHLRVSLASPGRSLEIIRSAAIGNYRGDIVLRVVSATQRYRLEYSLNGGRVFTPFHEADSDLILSRGYTGAYLGLYSTTNGAPGEDHADFDWVHYRGMPRK